ncbi:MAG: hypothetical protein KDC99_02560 [Cyclobacteriaceae bacterium]|nr:hypothetical protein [Cyclobacteriaceae bacterium]
MEKTEKHSINNFDSEVFKKLSDEDLYFIKSEYLTLAAADAQAYRENIEDYLQYDKTLSVGKEKNVTILLETSSIGRYLFHLAFFFLDTGHRVFLVAKSAIIARLDVYSKKLFPLNNFFLLFTVNSKGTIVSDSEKSHCDILLNFNYFSKTQASSKASFPFPMHPMQYLLGRYKELHSIRENKTKIKILFAGNLNESLYGRLSPKFGILQRHSVINKLITELTDEEILVLDSSYTSEKIQKGEFINKLVILDSRLGLVKPPTWLSFLSCSSFYLALPGVVNPLSHNIIESLAVGVIPITQYGHYLRPKLSDEVNSLSFDQNSLIPTIRKILNMDSEDFSSMRDSCISQYENHFSTQHFRNIIENRTTAIELIFNTGHSSAAQFIRGD